VRWRLAIGACALAAVAVVAVLVNRGVETATSPVAPPPNIDPGFVLMGLNGRTSDPFYLDGGSYRLLWSAWGETPGDPPCTHSVQLMPVDRANSGGFIYLARFVDVPSTGAGAEVDMSNLAPGAYYLQINSACAWQIEVRPS
jgi:hypothetical protein